LYNEYRRKVLVSEVNNSADGIHQSNRDAQAKGHLDYIEKLILKKKKKENMNAKMKEEFLSKEMEPCSFKPKINHTYHLSHRDEFVEENRAGRIDKLYKMGIQIISNRKDKDKHDIDIELHGKECTFQPNTEKKFMKEEEKINNDIFNEKRLRVNV